MEGRSQKWSGRSLTRLSSCRPEQLFLFQTRNCLKRCNHLIGHHLTLSPSTP